MFLAFFCINKDRILIFYEIKIPLGYLLNQLFFFFSFGEHETTWHFLIPLHGQNIQSLLPALRE